MPEHTTGKPSGTRPDQRAQAILDALGEPPGAIHFVAVGKDKKGRLKRAMGDGWQRIAAGAGMLAQHPGLGVMPGSAGLMAVDVDLDKDAKGEPLPKQEPPTEEREASAVAALGEPLGRIATPSGGVHLLYAAPKEGKPDRIWRWGEVISQTHQIVLYDDAEFGRAAAAAKTADPADPAALPRPRAVRKSDAAKAGFGFMPAAGAPEMVEDACRRMRAAAKGARNPTLNIVAFLLGKRGAWTPEAAAALRKAAHEAGLGGDRADETESTMNRAAADGAQAASDELRGPDGGERLELADEDEDGLSAALEHLKVEVRWNDRAARREYRGRGPWKRFTDRAEDALISKIRKRCAVMSADGKKPLRKPFCETAWNHALNAILFRREVDPVKDWMLSLPPWDGKQRIDRLLEDVWGCEDELAEWASQYLILAPIQRTMEPGCFLREIPVLIGKQLAGKSELGRAVCADGGWFSDSLDFSEKTKDRVEATLGKLIVEASEMAGAGRTEIESIKAFLSRRDDEIRLAYGRNPEPRPRRFAIIGTANDTGTGVLPNDPSGNSRFVPVKIGNHESRVGRIDLWAAARRDQWFAEGLSRYRDGIRANFPGHLRGMQAEAANRARRVDLGVEDRIAELSLPDETSAAEIADMLREPPEWAHQLAKRIAMALTNLGFVNARRQKTTPDGRRVAVWERAEIR